LYESFEFTQNTSKRFKYDELKNKKENLNKYVNSMDEILINGKKQSQLLTFKKEDNYGA